VILALPLSLTIMINNLLLIKISKEYSYLGRI
jgi:hypothetical protein